MRYEYPGDHRPAQEKDRFYFPPAYLQTLPVPQVQTARWLNAMLQIRPRCIVVAREYRPYGGLRLPAVHERAAHMAFGGVKRVEALQGTVLERTVLFGGKVQGSNPG